MCRSTLPNIKDLHPNVQLREGSIKYEKLLCEIENLRIATSSKSPRSRDTKRSDQPKATNLLQTASGQVIKSVFDWMVKDKKETGKNEIEEIVNDEQRMDTIRTRLQVLQLEQQHLQDELERYNQILEHQAAESRKRQEEADAEYAREYQRQIQEQLEQDEEFARRLQEQLNNEGNEDEILQPLRNEEPLFDVEDANLADLFEQQLNNIVERNSPRNQLVNHLKNCRHTCQLSQAVQNCCWCTDRRPISNGYERYVDGEGWRNDALRDQYYCMECIGKNDRMRH